MQTKTNQMMLLIHKANQQNIIKTHNICSENMKKAKKLKLRQTINAIIKSVV